MDTERDALTAAAEQVADRWTLLLVHALLDGAARYADLQQALPGISTSILSQRLRQLERGGLILATPYSERPVRFVYELTERGRELTGVLRLLAQWGSENLGGDAAVRHEACGTPAEARWWCPTCDRAVQDEATHLHHL